MANALNELSIATRFAAGALARRLRGEFDAEPDTALFETQVEAALATLGPEIIVSHQWLTLPATEAPWHDTCVTVTPEHDVSYFAAGRVHASRLLDIWVAPKNQIWSRLGEDGAVISSSRDSNSFSVDEPARLLLGNYFPNDWRDPDGSRLQDDKVYSTVSGETRICIVEWKGPAHVGLTAFAQAGDPCGIASRELERLAGAGAPPELWSYLWNIGEAEIFRSDKNAEGQPCIQCRVEGDVGILQKDVDFPVTPDCEISWNWIVEALPGVTREDTLPSHDYLSIAVEFDNGWDITYYWSTELPRETGYVCPLPNWKHREYHVVVRSGTAELGKPLSECRNLYRDTQHYMARHMDAPPERIVRVWLIANSIFARRVGRCSFSDIRVTDGASEVVVL